MRRSACLVLALTLVGGCVFDDRCVGGAERVGGVCQLVGNGDAGQADAALPPDAGPVRDGAADDGDVDGASPDSSADGGQRASIEFVSVAATHICVLRAAGNLICWGSNLFGGLATGTQGEASVTNRIDLPGTIISLSGNGLHTCAQNNLGQAFCWGANMDGQIDGRRVDPDSPDMPPALLDVLEPLERPIRAGAATIAAGFANTCSVSPGFGASCWGRHDNGQIGDGSPRSDEAVPAPGVRVQAFVEGETRDLESGAEVAIGDRHFCFRSFEGAVFCWGDNEQGQVGDGTTMFRGRAVPVPLPAAAVSIAAVFNRSCAALQDGRVFCWGSSSEGDLIPGEPAGSTYPTPTEVPGVMGAVEVVTAEEHACARTQDGRVFCWGVQAGGRVGNGEAASIEVASPVDIGLSNVTRLATGLRAFTCAVVDDLELFCWGEVDRQRRYLPHRRRADRRATDPGARAHQPLAVAAKRRDVMGSERHVLDQLEVEPFEACPALRVVRDQAQATGAELAEDLRSDPVVAIVHRAARVGRAFDVEEDPPFGPDLLERQRQGRVRGTREER